MACHCGRLINSVEKSFTRDMGFTLEEFMRPLPAAIAPLKYQVQGRQISIQHPEGEIHIKLNQAADRIIGALTIPRMQVEFSFHGPGEDQRELFMLQFDRHFQRGGG